MVFSYPCHHVLLFDRVKTRGNLILGVVMFSLAFAGHSQGCCSIIRFCRCFKLKDVQEATIEPDILQENEKPSSFSLHHIFLFLAHISIPVVFKANECLISQPWVHIIFMSACAHVCVYVFEGTAIHLLRERPKASHKQLGNNRSSNCFFCFFYAYLVIGLCLTFALKSLLNSPQLSLLKLQSCVINFHIKVRK